jgi:uncharacterized protein involved in exopolysaccharide biosynthesis
MKDINADRACSDGVATVLKVCLGLFLVLLFVVVAGGVAAVFLTPKTYYSKVTMEVRPDGPAAPASAYDPQFVASQFEAIQKTNILDRVIGRLTLTAIWAPPGKTLSEQEAYTKLRQSMRLQEVRNTGLIEIGVYDTDPQRAADIANEIAIIYQEKRREHANEGPVREFDLLEKEIQQQRQKVDAVAQSAMQIRARDGIVDSDPDKEDSSLEIAQQHSSIGGGEKSEKKIMVFEAKRVLALMDSGKPEDFRELIDVQHIDDQMISKNLALLEKASAEETRLKSLGVAENDPLVTEQEAQMKSCRVILNERLAGTRARMADMLDTAKKRLAEIEEEERRQGLWVDKQKQMSEYVAAKHKLIAERHVLEEKLLTYEQKKMDLTIRRPGAVIWEKAEPATGPENPLVALLQRVRRRYGTSQYHDE